MASAGIATPSSIRRRRTGSGSRRAQLLIVVAGSLLTFAIVLNQRQLGAWAAPATAALLTLFGCSFWYLHLQAGGFPDSWSVIFPSLLAAQLLIGFTHRLKPHAAAWEGALGCAAFAYAMLWIFNTQKHDAGLQSVATAALMLSIGILAKPPVLIACAVLSLAVFFEESRRLGGFLRSAVLLLTPLLLCVVAVAVLRALAIDAFRTWAVNSHPDPAPLRISSLAKQFPALPFCASVLTSRLFMRKIGNPDLAFLFLLVVLPTFGAAPWMPIPMSMLDISMIICWGAACLLALDPPLQLACRLVALVGLSFSVYFAR